MRIYGTVCLSEKREGSVYIHIQIVTTSSLRSKIQMNHTCADLCSPDTLGEIKIVFWSTYSPNR